MRKLLASLALALALLPGCGTLFSLSSLNDPDWKRDPLIFSGTRLDLSLGAEALPLTFLDLPLSFGLDAALLPITAPQSIVAWIHERRALRTR